MQKDKSTLSNGDILHFKYKGPLRFFKKLNPTQSAMFLTINGIDVVATVINGRVILIDWFSFNNQFQYVSSSPLWKKNPLRAVLVKIYSKDYKNSDQFIGEILGAKSFAQFKKGDVLKYCVKNGWLSV